MSANDPTSLGATPVGFDERPPPPTLPGVVTPRTGTVVMWQRRIWEIVARKAGRAALWGLALGVGLGMMAGTLKKQGATTWTSQAVMLLDDPRGLALSGDEGPLVKLSDLRYKYSSLAGTDAIAGPVASSLHVPVGVVLGSTSVSVPTNSLLLYVSSTWSTPGFAEVLAYSVAREISTYIQQENATNNIPAEDQFSALIVSPPAYAFASSPSTSKAILVGILGLVGGFAVGFVVCQAVAELYRRRHS